MPRRLNGIILERLPKYYNFLQERERRGGAAAVSSHEIAAGTGVDDTQIRKDLAAIGLKGCPRVGFSAREVATCLRRVLGFEQRYAAVLVGAGRLGGALAAYPGFQELGLTLSGVFDVDERKVGLAVGGLMVKPLAELEEFLRRFPVELGIIAVPAIAAQDVADRLIEGGVAALWNFAPLTLTAPAAVRVRNECLSIGLAELGYYVKCAREDRARA